MVRNAQTIRREFSNKGREPTFNRGTQLSLWAIWQGKTYASASDRIQKLGKDVKIMKLIQFMNDYREAVIFLSLVGIFLTGVYLGIITERQKWGK